MLRGMSTVVEALAGDSSLAALYEEARALHDGAVDQDPGHDFHHARRVASWTLRLAGPEADPRLCIAAALLHDAVNVRKDSPERGSASERSAALAREVLPRFGFTRGEVELVSDAIVDHSYSRGALPRSPLGRALQDADRLDALGALGLMRCVACGTRMGARFFHPDDPWAEERPLDDRRYSVDHFFTKLLSLAETMTTEEGRREAERRTAFLRAFLAELRGELAGA